MDNIKMVKYSQLQLFYLANMTLNVIFIHERRVKQITLQMEFFPAELNFIIFYALVFIYMCIILTTLHASFH